MMLMMNRKPMTNANFIVDYQQRINDVLQQHLLRDDQEPKLLHQAMRYAVFNGGKRIRPLLVYAVGRMFASDLTAFDIPAAAVELIHCYSLVHDDLPAMDDDDLRRGKPTCHKKFDEATAILAGDALQAQAFLLLAQDPNNSAINRLRLLQQLGEACGSLGMAGGQAKDLQATGKQLKLAELQQMHQMKTGALISASVLFGAIVAEPAEQACRALATFAQEIGLAYQIHDDILDVEGATELLGKRQGADQNLQKATYPAIVGLDQAKLLAKQAYNNAMAALKMFGNEADELRYLAAYIVQRDH